MRESYFLRSAERSDLGALVRAGHRHFLVGLLVSCFLTAASIKPAAAAVPATQPSAQDMYTPRDAMMAYDHWCVDLRDCDAAADFYCATTDQARLYVQQCVRFARVTAAIERLSRKTFGPAGCTAIMHEYGDADVPDLRSAQITIDGNIAHVRMATVHIEYQMIRIRGAWLIDSGYLMRMCGGLDGALQDSRTEIAELQPIADGLRAGKFKTPKAVIQAIDRAMGSPRQ